MTPLHGKNHIFLWSNSTLAIAPTPFFDPDILKNNGYVEAFTELQISPGHQKSVEESLITSFEDDFEVKSITLKESEYRLFHIGIPDWFFKNKYTNRTIEKGNSKSNADDYREFIPLFAVLHILKSNIECFGVKAKIDHGRDVIDLSTSLIIPIPHNFEGNENDEIFPDVDKNHFSLISESLSIIRKKLFYTTEGKLSLEKLKATPRLYNVPVSLRRNIEFLFQNYSSFFADPYTFDSIIDMFDSFVAFHKLLTDFLFNKTKQESQYSISQKSHLVLDDARVEQLSVFLTALHDSLLHRISKSYPETLYRDMAIDFRGGLNQMIFAADSYISCSLDLLKMIMKKENRSKNPFVGGLIKISYQPGARCYSFNFGVEKEIKLASFELDVPHIFHLPSYIENFHEVSHLIFEALISYDEANKVAIDIKNEDEVMKERLSEIFSNLLCQLFIFGSDISKSTYYNFCNYSKSITSIGNNDYATVTRFTEFLIRLFIVTDAIPENNDISYSANQWKWKEKKDTKKALQRFQKMISNYGIYFSEYERLWNDKRNSNYCYQQFLIIYPKSIDLMGQIWESAVRIHNDYIEVLNKGNFNSIETLNDQIRMGFDQGKPVVKKLLFRGKKENNEFVDGFVSLLICCRALYAYFPDVNELGLSTKKIHIYRDPQNDRMVEYPSDDKNKEWHKFQLDRGYSAMFCPVPQSRAERLRKQIILFKTFWDISASQRERCLKTIIAGHLSNEPC